MVSNAESITPPQLAEKWGVSYAHINRILQDHPELYHRVGNVRAIPPESVPELRRLSDEARAIAAKYSGEGA